MHCMQTLIAAMAVCIIHINSVNCEKCCEGICEIDGEEKYFSLDSRTNNCGECCMRPEDYDLYHKFEKNLLPANDTVTPCLDLHYNVYLETVTHGAGMLDVS